MLDTETKKKIDTARDILVGIVPDPKSQVEQITIALIYKFMDDMDAEAEELGGERKFFSGEFEKYSWAKLMSPAVGGNEMLHLYAEAITRITNNQRIPPLFRDIFKNAYLPYRNPETLRSFLRIINDFEYDHSERLGDAFEYLLSILGAQGDAGQFRTPRHIIDFMVSVINPKKDESILDPACGTAGFLISAWKHILQANSKAGRKGADLTPDERKRLTENIKGYDISPDMVRLSLVNLYLHGFTAPHISEYDTLTSEDNWNEYSDIILANPPFMSPRGGIKPHKRFSIQAKRSEVLFVDYIAEHLTPNGRAAVIVPEGIIFQSQNAYKQLRKMLIENYLYAVVSLPAGVFNPYSGVKTSILLLDKMLAKKCDSILFVKVENDGFNLGAQRRKIDKNDLPDALKTIQAFIYTDVMYAAGAGRAGAAIYTDVMYAAGAGRAGAAIYTDAQDNQDKKEQSCLSPNTLIVTKEKIAENGEWDLSGERYRESDDLRIGNYEIVELGEHVDILDKLRKPITKHKRVSGSYPYYGATGILDFVDSFLFDEKLVLVGEDGAKWNSGEKTAFAINGKTWVNNHAHVLRPQRDRILDVYLIALLVEMDLSPYITGVTVPKLNQAKLRSIKIPLPPLKIQQEIVAEIEGYQKIIDGARAVVDNYKPQIQINPDWERVKLGDVCEITSSKRVFQKDWKKDGIPFYRAREIVKIVNQGFVRNNLFISEEMYSEYSRKFGFPKEGDLMVTGVGTLGFCYRVNKGDKFYFKDGNIIWLRKFFEKVDSIFIKYLFENKAIKNQIKSFSSGGTVGTYTITNAKRTKISLPPLKTQKEIVAQIEKEQSLVNANKELITLFEQKIKDKIASVWGSK